MSGHLHCKSRDDGDQVGGDGDSSVCVASQHLLEHVPQVQRAVVCPCLHQLTLHFQLSQVTALGCYNIAASASELSDNSSHRVRMYANGKLMHRLQQLMGLHESSTHCPDQFIGQAATHFGRSNQAPDN